MLQDPNFFLLKQDIHVAQAALHFAETRSLAGTCGSLLWLNWLSSREPPVYFPIARNMCCHVWFLCGFWGSNSDPYAEGLHFTDSTVSSAFMVKWHFFHICVWLQIPLSAYDGQRILCWFSTSCGSRGLNSVHQAWSQVLLPAEGILPTQ